MPTGKLAVPIISVVRPARLLSINPSPVILSRTSFTGDQEGRDRCITKRRQPFCLLLADRLPNRVLHAADGILNLALGLLSLSFRFRLLVAQKLASCFLDATRKLLERPFDTIFVHHQAFSRYVIS